MSLYSTPIPPVPDETARVARAAFPRGNTVMQMRDALGTIYRDEQFADLFPSRVQPAEAPWRFALLTVFQFLEQLPDRQAADAVRSRLDWKYALSLELSDPGFDHTVLSEFRSRLEAHAAEERLLEVKWQAQAGQGFDAQSFLIDWDSQRAICPQGRASISWSPAIDNRQIPVIKIKFSTTDCGRYPVKTQCIRSRKRYVRRPIAVRPRDAYLALQARRAQVRTFGIPCRVCLPRRDRGDAHRRHTCPWDAALALCRPAAHPPGSCPDSCSYQPSAHRKLAGRHASG